MIGTLALAGVLALATAAGFFTVGAIVGLRSRPHEGGSARVMFALFWVSAGVVWTAQGIQNVAAALGLSSFSLAQALDQVTTPFYCLAAAGLLYYSLFLVTGRERLLIPVVAYYLVLFFLLRWRIEEANRLGVVVEDWVVRFEYETPLQSAAYTAIVALVALPVLAAIATYASVFFKVDEPGLRYRIVLTAVGLFAWVATEALAFVSGFANTAPGEVTRRLVALASAILVIAAQRPPRFARERWRAEPAL